MPGDRKRKVKARQILEDIRSGMDDAQLKRKYALSDGMLKSVYRKLEEASLLTEAERGGLGTEVAAPDGSSAHQGETPWRCPACGATQSLEAEECPACGIVVAKFLARRRTEESPTPPQPGFRGGRWWLYAWGAGALVVLAILFFHFNASRTIQEKPLATSRAASKKVVSGHVKAFKGKGGQLVRLQYSAEGFPLGLSTSQGFGFHLFERPGLDQKFTKMPPDNGARRYYDDFKIAGQTFLTIMEESDPPKLYVDANRNGDLTDDPGPFIGEHSGIAPNHYTIQLPYHDEKDGAAYRMWVFPSRMGGLRFYPKCHWHGQIVVNGTAYRIVTFDANSDGDYANDFAVIDTNSDGKAAASEKLIPGQTCTVDETRIQLVSIAPSGRWVRLKIEKPGQDR